MFLLFLICIVEICIIDFFWLGVILKLVCLGYLSISFFLLLIVKFDMLIKLLLRFICVLLEMKKFFGIDSVFLFLIFVLNFSFMFGLIMFVMLI